MRRRRRSGHAEIARLAAFSDAVIAIAITLLVLDLRVPAGLGEADFGRALGALGPELFSFALSFVVIGQFWMNHHRLFRHLQYYDDRLLALNLLFLLSVAFLPFPTAVLGEYMHHRRAMALYAVSIAVAGILFALLWTHIAYPGQLLGDEVDPKLRRRLLARFLSVPVIFLASVPVALAGQLHAAAARWIVLPVLVGYLTGRSRGDRAAESGSAAVR